MPDPTYPPKPDIDSLEVHKIQVMRSYFNPESGEFGGGREIADFVEKAGAARALTESEAHYDPQITALKARIAELEGVLGNLLDHMDLVLGYAASYDTRFPCGVTPPKVDEALGAAESTLTASTACRPKHTPATRAVDASIHGFTAELSDGTRIDPAKIQPNPESTTSGEEV